ncbi:MAG: Gfo/Idh/MocA family oxidoreductase [Treponema sp.]|nr:Gfo/Idh/MocA family oxidoreductase [Treponema sp.]
MNKYKSALIGCGKIGPAHIKAFAENRISMELEATCDPVIQRAEEQAGEYRNQVPESNIRSYADYKKMLCEVKPDIVAITTESGKHSEIAIDCLRAGAHVICEKPMALSTGDADTMISVAKSEGKKLAVCFQNRFNTPVQKLRAAIDAGRFGRLLHGMIQVRWHRSPSYYAEDAWRGTWAQDGGTLMNQCIHGIDLLQWIMGEDAVRVNAVTRRFVRPIEAEDFGAAIIEFESGAVGLIEGSVCVYPTDLSQTLSVFGEKGSVVIGGLAVNKMETWCFADAEAVGDIGDKALDPVARELANTYGSGHFDIFQDFVMAIEENREPLASGTSAKKALEIVLAIYKSQKTGQAVELPCDFSTLEMEGYFSK